MSDDPTLTEHPLTEHIGAEFFRLIGLIGMPVMVFVPSGVQCVYSFGVGPHSNGTKSQNSAALVHRLSVSDRPCYLLWGPVHGDFISY